MAPLLRKEDFLKIFLANRSQKSKSPFEKEKIFKKRALSRFYKFKINESALLIYNFEEKKLFMQIDNPQIPAQFL